MLAKKKSKAQREKIKFIVIISVTLLLLGGLLYAVFYSPLFQIKEIQITGAQFTDPTEISEGGRKNILFWKPPVEIDELPHVATHTIEKKYVDREILVSLYERERTTIWCIEPTRNCFWTDNRGYIFSRAPYPAGALVVKIVRESTERNLRLGEFVLPEHLHANLEKVFTLLEETDVPVIEVRIDELKYEEMTVTLAAGPDIYFGLSHDPTYGKSVIQSLQTSSEWSLMQYLDLRVENRAYYSL